MLFCFVILLICDLLVCWFVAMSVIWSYHLLHICQEKSPKSGKNSCRRKRSFCPPPVWKWKTKSKVTTQYPPRSVLLSKHCPCIIYKESVTWCKHPRDQIWPIFRVFTFILIEPSPTHVSTIIWPTTKNDMTNDWQTTIMLIVALTLTIFDDVPRLMFQGVGNVSPDERATGILHGEELNKSTGHPCSLSQVGWRWLSWWRWWWWWCWWWRREGSSHTDTLALSLRYACVWWWRWLSWEGRVGSRTSPLKANILKGRSLCFNFTSFKLCFLSVFWV